MNLGKPIVIVLSVIALLGCQTSPAEKSETSTTTKPRLDPAAERRAQQEEQRQARERSKQEEAERRKQEREQKKAAAKAEQEAREERRRLEEERRKEAERIERERHWIVASNNGCKVWNPDPVPNEAVKWSGACVNGLAHGRGTVQWFKDGKPNGIQTGEYKEGEWTGEGKDYIEVWPNGIRYEGEIRGRKRNGYGVMTVPKVAYVSENRSSLGEWRGNNWVEQGWFNSGGLEFRCTSRPVCLSIIEAKKQQEEAESRACWNKRQGCYAHCPPKATGFQLDSSARIQCELSCDRASGC